jgi:tetratricopeptide (TPR) repeat protein
MPLSGAPVPGNQAAAAQQWAQTENFVREQKWGQASASCEAYRKLLETGTYSAGEYNNLAWFYVAGPKPLRDAKKALPLAQKAVEKEPQNSYSLNTLGVVYYRLGKFDQAIKTLDRAAAGRQGGTAFDYFFLAMSYHHLGQPQKAREYYQKADGWWKRQGSISPQWTQELTDFRMEADALLTGKSMEQIEAAARQQWIKDLGSKDAGARRKAAEALVQLASPTPAEAEAKGPCGQVRSQADRFQMVLASADRVLRVQTDKNQAQVPVGSYQVLQATLTRKDDRGRQWELQAAGGESREAVKVVAGKTTELPIGFPVQAQAVSQVRGRTVNFSLQMTEATGLPVSSIMVNGARPPAPKLRIKQENGREVGLYAFQYG